MSSVFPWIVIRAMEKPTNESKALISNFHGLINAPINQRNLRAIVGLGYQRDLRGPIHRKGQQTSNNTKYLWPLRAGRPNSPTAHKPNQLSGSECTGLHQRDAIKQLIPSISASSTNLTERPHHAVRLIYIYGFNFHMVRTNFHIYANYNLIWAAPCIYCWQYILFLVHNVPSP